MNELRNAYYTEYEDQEMYARPARRLPPRRKLPASERVLRYLKRNPKRLLGGSLFFGIAAVVAINALVMQTSRHPSPMFAAPVPMPPVAQRAAAPAIAPPQQVATAPQVPAFITAPLPTQAAGEAARPPAGSSGDDHGDAIGDIIRTGSTSTAAVPVPRPAAVPQPPQRRDAIADLIRSNGVAPARQAAGSAATTAGENDKRIVAAGQQALNKLGYGPLMADGVLGSGTRRAIERFEFDRRLPVTGTFNAQTVSELSATSRIAIR